MKKYIGLLLTFLLLTVSPLYICAENETPWEAEYTRIMQSVSRSKDTKFVLADVDFNNVPELIAGNKKTVSLYRFDNNSVMKLAKMDDIPIDFFAQINRMQHNTTNQSVFIGQFESDGECTTYQIHFTSAAPKLKIIAREHSDGTGAFWGDGETEQSVIDCSALVSEYLAAYTAKPFTRSILTAEEIDATDFETAAKHLFARYHFLTSLSDDTADFSADERELIKSAVGSGQFAAFEKISRLGHNELFIQFYSMDKTKPANRILSYQKQYAVVTKAENGFFVVSAAYASEAALDLAYLTSLGIAENRASNILINYTKTESFRGIDDYVYYLSSVISAAGKTANENGKETITEYIEHAVNLCSRTEIKANDNVISVNSYAVSFIAEHAVTCLARFNTLCDSNNIVLNRNPRALPELICANLDLARPIRIEFEPGLSAKLAGSSGIRLMLDKHHGIYITGSDLAVLENKTDTFCIEFIHKQNAFSVVFTDKNNQPISYLDAPVWFIVPAKSQYSTVMASFQGGTDNWGGQYDAKNETLEFSTNYAGDYEIVENDITINDISGLPQDTKNAIRFLVSKGIFTLDDARNFNPDATLSRYDFTAALVRMFYSLNLDARTSFTDVAEDSWIYRYVASAESQGIATGYADGTFRGTKPVSREQVVTLCGRTLAEKKGYAYPTDIALLFSDTDQISAWAMEDVAIAVQHGLIDNFGEFTPLGSVSRAEGAQILYKTFMLIYSVSPVTTSPSMQAETTAVLNTPTPTPIDLEFRAALAILISVFIVFIGYILIKIKRHRKKTKQKNKNN